jgi:hypothetical protein
MRQLSHEDRGPVTQPDEGPPRATGSCLCGSIRFRVMGPLRDVRVCHCLFCRRAHSHVAAYTACAPGDLRLDSARTLRWYRTSPRARRGFCAKCGSSLLWEPASGEHIAIAAGSLNGPTGLRIAEHIHTEQKGDYYGIEAARHEGPEIGVG